MSVHETGSGLQSPPMVRPGAPALLEVAPDQAVGAWLAARRGALREAVTTHGAVVVRGLALADVAGADDAFRALADELMSDEEAFAQRRLLAPGVYSSATWPDQQPMCMHHELSYRQQVPGLAMFACLVAPQAGGATGVADAGDVLAALPADLVDRFARQGWMLLRHYGEEIGPSVAEAFGTDDPAQVSAYCSAHAIEATWGADGSLSTRQRRPAVITHPRSGRRVWVNQIAFLSEWTIEPEIREFLVDVYGAEGLPFTTAYGDGEPIESTVIELLNEVYETHTRRDPWQAGDLMLVDNLSTAHSREAFTGPREVLVALGEPVDLAPLAEVTQ